MARFPYRWQFSHTKQVTSNKVKHKSLNLTAWPSGDGLGLGHRQRSVFPERDMSAVSTEGSIWMSRSEVESSYSSAPLGNRAGPGQEQIPATSVSSNRSETSKQKGVR